MTTLLVKEYTDGLHFNTALNSLADYQQVSERLGTHFIVDEKRWGSSGHPLNERGVPLSSVDYFASQTGAQELNQGSLRTERRSKDFPSDDSVLGRPKPQDGKRKRNL